MNKNAPFLEVRGLKKWFDAGSGIFSRGAGQVKAVDDVSFVIEQGEVLGLVGESGSGKTTVGRTILRLNDATSGAILFKGVDIAGLGQAALRAFRRQAQPIFQDPFASLNPRMRVEEIVAEPLVIHGIGAGRAERHARVSEILRLVGLLPDHMSRYPHEFSGGQRQRIGIARALAVGPEFIVADEPVSALDVSIQAQVVNLLRELKQKLGLTMLFIAHDLAVVEYISDRIVVMYLGRVMETAPGRELCRKPRHPYTEALLSAVPVPDPDRKGKRIVLKGDIPSPINPPSGCVFRTRCPYAIDECAKRVPELREISPGRYKACIRDDILESE
ncbi:MAG TPA: oligopeptide/dipeptide ABC transporter ATP-binding protein [Alphaproteobacteria bacterium]|nr:oligopeptide/dipeptide ABC transporter ATP-binding protein [Alphaproteobacteria bacterium]